MAKKQSQLTHARFVCADKSLPHHSQWRFAHATNVAAARGDLAAAPAAESRCRMPSRGHRSRRTQKGSRRHLPAHAWRSSRQRATDEHDSKAGCERNNRVRPTPARGHAPVSDFASCWLGQQEAKPCQAWLSRCADARQRACLREWCHNTSKHGMVPPSARSTSRSAAMRRDERPLTMTAEGFSK